jgi:ribosome recycling factor
MKNDKQLSEDDFKRVEKDLDKSIAELQSKIEEITKAKEKEILTI